MSDRLDTPVYKLLIRNVRLGFKALDVSVQQEIIDFIAEKQDLNGGFHDRAGNSDPYYSLFGLWLSVATGQDQNIEKMKSYVAGENQFSSPVEELAQELIKTELFPTKRKKSGLSLINKVFKNNNSIDLSYRFFLLTLAIDASGKNKSLYYFFARIWLYFYQPKGNIPCSLVAALIYAKKILGLNFKILQNKLVEYYAEESGFRSFHSVAQSDTLSTGVALFVLKETDFDLRIITPDCLNFIQQNYRSGAFLSGDGDNTRDVEYTFYGLLALGSLINHEE